MAYHSCDYFISVISNLRKTKKFIDATIALDDWTFHDVHKPILATHSQFFQALFTHENRGVYTLSKVPSKEFNWILDWIYDHKMSLNLENCINVVIVSDFLGCLEVMEVASETIKSQINVQNVLEILNICICYNLFDLANACKMFLSQHFSEVNKGEDFLELDYVSLKQVLSYLGSVGDDELWDAILTWMKCDEELRLNQILSDQNLMMNQANVTDAKLNKLLPKVPSKSLAIQLSKLFPVSRKSNQIVLAGGPMSNDFFATYDPIADNWSHLAHPDLSQITFSFSMQAIDELVYLVGVKTDDHMDRSSHALCLNLKSGSVKKISPMDEMRFYFCMTSFNGQLYCFGGQSENDSNHNSAETYDPVLNQWDELPSMINLHTQGAAIGYNGRIYVAGGRVNNRTLDVVDCYNPRARRWSHSPNMIYSRSGLGLVVANGELYALGGTDDYRTLRSCEKFSDEKWTLMPPMLTSRSNFGSIVAHGKILVAGGNDGLGNPLTSVEMFDPETLTWTSVEPMVTPRSRFSLCNIQNDEQGPNTSEANV